MLEKSEGAAGEPTEVDRLVSLMLKKIYYVMHRRITVAERAGSVLLDHLRWLIDLEKQGLVFASGPIFVRGDKTAGGMTLFRVDSFDEAERLAESDPSAFQGGGVRRG